MSCMSVRRVSKSTCVVECAEGAAAGEAAAPAEAGALSARAPAAAGAGAGDGASAGAVAAFESELVRVALVWRVYESIREYMRVYESIWRVYGENRPILENSRVYESI